VSPLANGRPRIVAPHRHEGGIMSTTIDVDELRGKVKTVYQQVAADPHAGFHFETGRGLAERLGYEVDDLDRIPSAAIDSFAGVGYHMDLARLTRGRRVLDLGSGSGMDSFVAASRVGPAGAVVGLDMTDEQLAKARSLAAQHGLEQVSFERGYIEEIPLEAASVDTVISNGVINLAADKEAVFREIARVLEPGGRMAISDIVTEQELTENIVCDTSLWAACIGGAAQQDRYRAMIEAAGLRVEAVRDNPQYQFLSKSARSASETFGVKSVSLAATKPA
jgi:arsenite methyltransferase